MRSLHIKVCWVCYGENSICCLALQKTSEGVKWLPSPIVSSIPWFVFLFHFILLLNFLPSNQAGIWSACLVTLLHSWTLVKSSMDINLRSDLYWICWPSLRKHVFQLSIVNKLIVHICIHRRIENKANDISINFMWLI